MSTCGTDSWRDRIFRKWKEEAKWRTSFNFIYPLYAGSMQKQDPSEDKHYLPHLVPSIAQFLDDCGKEGMSLTLDKRLLDLNGAQEALNRLESEQRREFLSKLAALMSGESTDQATWTQMLDGLFRHSLFRVAELERADIAMDEKEIIAQKAGARDFFDAYSEAQSCIVTMSAWKIPYRGSLDERLWEHICTPYVDNEITGKGYANLCAIIQSSGTGKSRMVDQLGKNHFVIPVCLREPNATGFPPSDHDVHRYLLQPMSGYNARSRVSAFLQAVFEQAKHEVESISSAIKDAPDKYVQVSEQFRRRMMSFESYKRYGAFRTSFYGNIVRRAAELGNRSENEEARELAESCEFLTTCLGELVPQSKRGPLPLVIIAFDESGGLAIPPPDRPGMVPVLSTLCNRLHGLRDKPLFALFLSTSGYIVPFLSPSGPPDPSRRLFSQELRIYPAFTPCVFDEFSLEKFVKGNLTIQDASSEWTMMHLGRPLWALRVDKSPTEANSSRTSSSDSSTTTWKGQINSLDSSITTSESQSSLPDESMMHIMRRDAMSHTVAKLLNVGGLNWDVSDVQAIACLCHRLPIEFQSSSPFQYKIVEDHMRICLRLDPEDGTVLTMSSSEPVLAEAASLVMMNQEDGAVNAMQHILSSPVNRGDRGELVALFILLLARDDVVRAKNYPRMWTAAALMDNRVPGRSSSGYSVHPADPELLEWNRVFTVPEYLRKLFGEIPGIQDSIDKLFRDARMHFNHFVKGYEQRILRCQYLAGLLMRGAALLCANCQESIDAAIPVLAPGQDKINRSNVSCILFQMKLGVDHTDKPDWTINDRMCPYRLGIFENTAQCLPPVIRVVFALGSNRKAVKARATMVVLDEGRRYTAIDIWCAGVSKDILPCIAGRDETVWDTLVDRARGWKSNYIPPLQESAEADLQRMTPCLATEPQFWESCPGLFGDDEGDPEQLRQDHSSWMNNYENATDMVEQKGRSKRRRMG